MQKSLLFHVTHQYLMAMEAPMAFTDHFSCVFLGGFLGFFFLPQLYLINVIIIKTNAFTFIYFMVSSQEQQKHLIFWHDVRTII